MKKSGITFFVVLLIVLSIIAVYSGVPKTHVEYLRIHIRADSNEPSAQQVKYYVKERVVDYLTPYLAECNTKAAAINTLTERMGEIERICCAALKEKGFDYGATARLKSENFPTRTYGELTLESGFYDALIIELGSGEGDNWWCVVYPPLCFTESNALYVYKSKIYEIIKGFFEGN